MSLGCALGLPTQIGWTIEPDLDPLDERLRRRRWCILRTVLLRRSGDTLPEWINTPEQFIGWIVGRLAPKPLTNYFTEIEDIAKQTCDLELLRLARQYLSPQ